jgi:capsular polysaccharide biosynthesis protein
VLSMESAPEAFGVAEDESDSSNAVTPAEILSYVIGSAKRHKWLGAIVTTVVASVGVLVALVIPPKYDAEARILAVQSVAVASALSTLNRSVGGNFDPFGGSTETLMQKSNLLWIVQEANLVPRWKASRTWAHHLKDAILSGGTPSYPPDPILATRLADTLAGKMYVYHSPDVLTIHVAWGDADSALKIAQLAKSRFLDLRRQQELAVITAAIAVNEDEVKRSAESIDQALEELIKVRNRVRQAEPGALTTTAQTHGGVVVAGKSPASGSAKSAVEEAPAAPVVPPTQKLAARLAAIRQEAREIEAPWQRRLAELKFQLTDLRGTYGPEHPIVVQQSAKIKEASTPPPELAALQAQEANLLAELEGATRAQAEASVSNSPSDSANPGKRRTAAVSGPRIFGSSMMTGSTTRSAGSERERDEDPTVAPAQARLSAAIKRYEETSNRLETSRLELVSSQVALQSQYVVVGEPERPKGPTRPNRPLLILAALLGSVVLGFTSGAMRELLSGRLFAAWQVRSMGYPVLGEIPLTAIQRDRA